MLQQFIIVLKNITLYQNTVYDYMLAVLVFISLFIILKIFESLIITRLKILAKKTKTDLDDIIIEIIHNIKPSIYLLLSLYFGIQFVILPNIFQTIVKIFFFIAIVYEIIQALDRIISYVIHKYLAKKNHNQNDKQSNGIIKIITGVSKTFFWFIGILLILQNLGINVTSLIASLGIGGLAIALALQTVLSDLISSISIYMDKPFEVGDFITIGHNSGTVEKIGLKTTRLKSTKGEELVISNKELTSARVQNFKRLEKRREAFSFGVTYNTSADKLQKIPTILKNIIENQELASFDRCHFSKYSESSLDFDTVFYVATQNYTEFMDVKQKINLAIFRAFEKENIEFAYPTQTIYIKK